MVPTVVLIGTGTSVGKTYLAERLLRALSAEGYPSVGFKPVESGIAPGGDSDDSDIERIRRASSFHVQPPPRSQTFKTPVSPHLASRLEGRPLDLETIRQEIHRAQQTEASLLLIELPGGAFSPLTEELCCAEFARTINAASVLLVAPDRLGVLHDVGSACRASAALGLPLHGIVLSASAESDASVGTNAAELPRVTAVPLLAYLPRAASDGDLAPNDPCRSLARHLLRGSTA